NLKLRCRSATSYPSRVRANRSSASRVSCSTPVPIGTSRSTMKGFCGSVTRAPLLEDEPGEVHRADLLGAVRLPEHLPEGGEELSLQRRPAGGRQQPCVRLLAEQGDRLILQVGRVVRFLGEVGRFGHL